jgi:hypothetical protein
MAEPAKQAFDEVPVVDSGAIEREYRRRRAKRRVLEERSRARRNANIRFWVIVVALLAFGVYLAVAIWNQVQNLFGI